MSAGELKIGGVYVLRGLAADPTKPYHAERRPPAIGKLVSFLPGGRPFFKLRFGRARWAPRGRIVELENIEREATQRERLIGIPLGVPTVAS